MADVPEHDRWMSETERERIEQFVFTKRRDETRLGRWTAKRTLAHTLGLDDEPDLLRDLVIRNAHDGAPEAFVRTRPVPLRISMTDRADWAVCMVVEGEFEIGCDLELVEPRSRAFVSDWFTVAEQRLVADTAHDPDLVANLIWSAKESALKVMRTGLRRDTRSVEVTVGGGAGHDEWRDLAVRSIEGTVFHGQWRRFGQFVLTCACEVPIAPPISLVHPSPLTTAEPGHTWMRRPRVTPRADT
jgi:4'-phosphopantetheinyl transferase